MELPATGAPKPLRVLSHNERAAQTIQWYRNEGLPLREIAELMDLPADRVRHWTRTGRITMMLEATGMEPTPPPAALGELGGREKLTHDEYVVRGSAGGTHTPQHTRAPAHIRGKETR